MKKIFALALTALLASVLVGCGNSPDGDRQKSESSIVLPH